MNPVDSCGWIEYASDGHNASFYPSALKNVSELIVPAVCIYEVFKSVAAQGGWDAAPDVSDFMRQGRVVGLGAEIAVLAAELSRELNLPMAGAFILATARKHAALLWTQDKHFKGLDGVEYIEG